MAYEKTTWAAGDVVTAAKLNNLENGVANASVIILDGTQENNTLKLNMTAGDLYTAIKSGHTIILREIDGSDDHELLYTLKWADSGQVYRFVFNWIFNDAPLIFIASSADDYPKYLITDDDNDDDIQE